MQTYRMTDEEFGELMETLKPSPYMVFCGAEPRSPHERLMDVWRKVASRVGCDLYSISPAGTGDNRYFKARPLNSL